MADHKFRWSVPYDHGWGFTGFCSCGFEVHARTAAAAADKVYYHIKRMEWKGEDVEHARAVYTATNKKGDTDE